MLSKLLDAVNGRKTYAGALVVGIVAFLQAAGLVDAHTAQLLTQIGTAIVVAGAAHKAVKLGDLLKALLSGK